MSEVTIAHISTLYNRVEMCVNEIHELEKENGKLRVKIEIQEEELQYQNKKFARGIAYNFAKNINTNKEIQKMKENEITTDNKISYIMYFIERMSEWTNNIINNWTNEWAYDWTENWTNNIPNERENN